ncbi:hypothetical protein D1815_21395 [Aquimarina sp. AD1]|uniref:hypothetical protein n=1 Tax=Aquimarina TaxID=290174 RepID=UPI0003FFC2BA|nr:MULTISPECIES: hypothetical protein [Aquimarina]AXT58193.1 hypothetical protein D1815_21395 [Aquimarina sp. AD1]RKN28058.1 hypothetical protein D7035_08525 [Aquimarina sp. AD1]
MKKILIFFIISITSLSCNNKGKDGGIKTKTKSDFEKYDELVWSGMLNFKDKDYQNALSNFQDAFKIKPDESTSDYFYASASALNLKQDKVAKDFIITAIQKTNASENYFDSFDEFNAFRENKLFSEIKARYSKYKTDYTNNLKNPEIYKEIELLAERDQKVRTDGSSVEEMQRVDSLNIKRLIEINKEYGWYDRQWILLWHHRGIHRENNYVWNYFRPLINKKIEKGELRKNYWARFDDENSMLRGKGVQIYGTYWNNYDQFPIENINTVDSLRNTVGLPPLAYIEKVYDVELPEGYTVKMPLTRYKKNREN